LFMLNFFITEVKDHARLLMNWRVAKVKRV
jgi:hypothetical protein